MTRILSLFLTLLAATPLPAAEKAAWETVTDAQIAKIEYDDAEVDDAYVTPLARDLTHLQDDAKKRLDEITDKMDKWKPGDEKDIGQKVRNWIALCTLTDITYGEFEAELPHVIFERLKKDVPQEKLIKALAWVILKPDEGKVVIKAPDLGLDVDAEEQEVRYRSTIYAKKLLGRLLGKLPKKE